MGRLADKNILITAATAGSGCCSAGIRPRGRARPICGLNEGRCRRQGDALDSEVSPFVPTSASRDLDTMFATISGSSGTWTAFFVNAGHSDFRLFEEVTEQSFDKVIAVDFKGFTSRFKKPLRYSDKARL